MWVGKNMDARMVHLLGKINEKYNILTHLRYSIQKNKSSQV